METGRSWFMSSPQKGKGYGRREAIRRQVFTRSGQVRCRHRRAGKGQTECAGVSDVFGQEPSRKRRRTRRSSANHRRRSGRRKPGSTFRQFLPERTFDVGIAEQHAVTFAAGLATEGYKPFCAIYSTFLQRGYDQIVHDVAIPEPAGAASRSIAPALSAPTAATHAGSFDNAYLGCLPNFVIMASVGRGRTGAHGSDPGRDQRSPERGSVIPRGEGPRRAMRMPARQPGGARSEIGNKGASFAKGTKIAFYCRSARVSPNARSACGRTCRAWAVNYMPTRAS